MTSSIEKQNTKYILPRISRSKSNRTTKFDQLLIYNKILFFKNHAKNEAGKLISDLFLLFDKAL